MRLERNVALLLKVHVLVAAATITQRAGYQLLVRSEGDRHEPPNTWQPLASVSDLVVLTLSARKMGAVAPMLCPSLFRVGNRAGFLIR